MYKSASSERNIIMWKKLLLVFVLILAVLQLATGSSAATTAPSSALVASTPEPLTAAAAATISTKGGPNPVVQLAGYLKDSVVRTVNGCGQLWKNHQQCNEIRAKQRDHRERLQKKWVTEGRLTSEEMKERLKSVNGGITYSDYTFLSKGKEDRGKLMNVVFLMFGAPRFLPYALMFYPEMLPSPFAPLPDSSVRESGLEKLSRERSHAVVQTLLNIENDAKRIPALAKLNIFGKKAQQQQMDTMEKIGEVTAKVFRAPGARGAYGAQLFLNNFDQYFYRSTDFSRAEKRLVDVPKSILKGVIVAVEGPSPLGSFLPNFLNRGKVISHIKRISDSDEFLVNEAIDLSTIEPTLLLEACNERFIGALGQSDEELRESLGEWLDLAVKQPSAKVQQTGQFYNSNLGRLSLLCYNALDSTRDERSASYLPRLLYQGQLLDSPGAEEAQKASDKSKKSK